MKGRTNNLDDVVKSNKKAWEHRVYEWRVKCQGSPKSVAKDMIKNPKEYLRCHSEFFSDVEGKTIASICGSDGRRAVALALLGAKATVFDISEQQKKYALELAKEANVKINYEIGDICLIDENKYHCKFDYAYAEGGILHYFKDLKLFFSKIYSILSDNCFFIMSDYHPFQKTCKVDIPKRNIEQTNGNYFDTRMHSGHVPYFKYFSKKDQEQFPECQLRFYTLSEIFNAMIDAGFEIKRFYEHPKVEGDLIPFEFTIIAQKNVKYKCGVYINMNFKSARCNKNIIMGDKKK